ncbi:MAG: putative F420-dependent oxidoreductase [Ilumatobacteraceae bacterium]|nr:putative F420-dependent oxidoreductase [Ilumatobacteraceae bacterium]
MELGLHIADFTWPGGGAELAPRLVNLAQTAEHVGFERITVMDHLWQIGVIGPEEHEMLEAYTTLGFLAASTTRVKLHTLVTGVVYREPGLLAKAVTTLDILSGGRAGLGIGAAWNADESAGLGLPFPPTAERFERLEEALQICLQMWSDSEAAYTGKHYRLARTLSSPQSATRPKIMIGGTGERKTLRLVAKYADQCNVFAGPEAAHKLEVLRQHCDREGRDYDAIEKTATGHYDPTESTGAMLDQFRALHDIGITVVYLMVRGPDPVASVEHIGATLIPELSQW